MISYKKLKSEEDRIKESNRIICKHPTYIPVIIETDDKKIKLSKRKFLAPNYASASYLSVTIQKHLPKEITKNGQISIPMFYKYKTTKKNFLGVETEVENTVMINGTNMMSDVYNDYKNRNNIKENSQADIFLYIFVICESTFGVSL